MRMETHINTLPNETLIHILSFVNEYELFFSALVCRKWRDCAEYLRTRNGKSRWLTSVNQIAVSIKRIIFYKQISQPQDYQFDYLIGDILINQNTPDLFMKAKNEAKLIINNKHFITICCKYNNIGQLMMIHSRGYLINNDDINTAITHKNYNIMFWAIHNNYQLDFDNIIHIIRNNDIDVLRKLHEINVLNDENFDDDDISLILTELHDLKYYHILQWMHQIGFVAICSADLCYAVEANDIDMCRWVLSNNIDIDEDEIISITESAIKTGNMEIILFLHERNLIDNNDSEAYYIAVKNNSYDIIQWLISIGCPIPHYALSIACNNCDVNMLNYLISKGFDMFHNEFSIRDALHGGKLENIKWLHTHGYRWDDNTIMDASVSGNVELVKWLKECGCKMNGMIHISIIQRGYIDMIKYLFENGCTLPDDICIEACKYNRIDILKWYYMKTNTFDENACLIACSTRNYNIMKWAYSVGIKLNYRMYNLAISNGDIDILDWLHVNECPINQDEAFTSAGTNVHIITWLVNKGYNTRINMTRRFIQTNDNRGIELMRSYGFR